MNCNYTFPVDLASNIISEHVLLFVSFRKMFIFRFLEIFRHKKSPSKIYFYSDFDDNSFDKDIVAWMGVSDWFAPTVARTYSCVVY